MRFLALTNFIGVSSALQTLPPAPWLSNSSSATGISVLSGERRVFINADFARVRDVGGSTLIPPSAYEFANTFRQDLGALFGAKWTLEQVDNLTGPGIHLGPFRGDIGQLTYENGERTEEGYEIEVTDGRIYIGGSGARGLFWGTRTLLQQLLIANGSALPNGRTVEAPAYATRGYMLDAGRKWYTADFLKELCTYASFFKLSEFHYHSSDNYPLNRGRNETWNKVFSHFSLYPEKNAALQGIIERKNETLSRAEFEDLQRHCAQRGVTVIPEIEAPGHALAITKWKPELALAKRDLLNLSHPDAIPTVKAIWTEFLPWFQTKEVHIGADEYDPDLADDYINFVNEMSTFIKATSGKRTRIWGTYEPSENLTVSKDIIIQHWQYGQSDPVQLHRDGYNIVNSQDWWAYMSLKNDHMPILPAPYPQFYNVSRTLNFADVPGWQWEPRLFNQVNITQQLPAGANGNKGSILAAWNDNGPDATTQLEAYYAMREGIAIMGARAWSGSRGVNLSAEEFEGSVRFLASLAPGQNLDRKILPQGKPLPFVWTPASSPASKSELGIGSYGPPYTLSLNISGPFTLSGPDTSLSLSNVPTNSTLSNDTTVQTLVFSTADKFMYPLRSVSSNDGHDSGHPGRIWTNQSSSTHVPVQIALPAAIRIETDVQNGTRVWVNGTFTGRFEVFVYGGRNTLFSWSQMALVAPVQSIEGGVQGLRLEDGLGRRRGNSGGGEGAGQSNDAGQTKGSRCILWLLFGVGILLI